MNAPMTMPPVRDRIVRMPEVEHRTGLHRATINRRIKAGTFPHGIALGVNSTGWYESDLDAWIANPMGWTAARAA